MLRFAIVGCGKMAHWHAEELTKIPDVKVVALADPVAERTAEFRQKYFPEAAEFGSLESIFAAGVKLDAVNLVTPHTLHYPEAKMALERGAHVLSDKPLVTRSQDACDLWRISKAAGKLVGITYQAPYSPEFGYLAELRDSGRLGKVQTISGWVGQNWLRGSANTWRQDPEFSGGGMMYDTGAHLFNAALWLMNEPVVEAGCFYDKCDSHVDINGVAIARFAGGALASFCVGGNCGAFGKDLQILTDAMLIQTDPWGRSLTITGRDGQRIYPHVKQDFQTPAAGTPHANFVKAMLGQEPLRVDARYGVLLTTLMDALYESASQRRIVAVTPPPQA